MRSWEEFERSMRNYTWLGDAVPGAMDVDFLIERRGQFLVLEFKPWANGVSMGFGQNLALERLALLDVFEVYLVGESERTDALYMCRFGERSPVKKGTGPVWYPPRRFTRMSKAKMRTFVKTWWRDVERAV